MKHKFSLEEYLAHPEKKVVTRDGRRARVICTDRKFGYPIIALAYNADEDKEVYINAKADGTAQCEIKDNLFFADEEPELTEFEKAIKDLVLAIDEGELRELGVFEEENLGAWAVKKAAELLDLARKEIMDGWGRGLRDTQDLSGKAYSDGYSLGYETGYERGMVEALKDLPRWKKATRNTEIDQIAFVLFPDGKVGHSRVATDDCYYIDPVDMLKLPKEE